MGEAWESVEVKPSRPVSFRVVKPDGAIEEFSLGAHAPKLTEEEIEAIHDLWRELSEQESLRGLHHHDIVAIAVERLTRELRGGRRAEVLQRLAALVRR